MNTFPLTGGQRSKFEAERPAGMDDLIYGLELLTRAQAEIKNMGLCEAYDRSTECLLYIEMAKELLTGRSDEEVQG